MVPRVTSYSNRQIQTLHLVETSCLNTDMCKFKPSQKDETESPFGWFLVSLQQI